jgi:hypothetical protein
MSASSACPAALSCPRIAIRTDSNAAEASVGSPAAKAVQVRTAALRTSRLTGCDSHHRRSVSDASRRVSGGIGIAAPGSAAPASRATCHATTSAARNAGVATASSCAATLSMGKRPTGVAGETGTWGRYPAHPVYVAVA